MKALHCADCKDYSPIQGERRGICQSKPESAKRKWTYPSGNPCSRFKQRKDSGPGSVVVELGRRSAMEKQIEELRIVQQAFTPRAKEYRYIESAIATIITLSDKVTALPELNTGPGRWIPCSEQPVPEEDGRYMVYLANDKMVARTAEHGRWRTVKNSSHIQPVAWYTIRIPRFKDKED